MIYDTENLRYVTYTGLERSRGMNAAGIECSTYTIPRPFDPVSALHLE